MTTLLTTPSSPTEQLENDARRVGERLLHGKSSDALTGLLLDHVLTTYREADWPVRRAAIEALARRVDATRREDLRVASSPAGRVWSGVYTTRRPRETARPYRTLLTSLEPLVASCDCPDFRSNSLGVCKHVLAVLADLARRPRVFAAARAAGIPAVAHPRLGWHPIKPLFGPGDWLERVSLEHGGDRASLASWSDLRARFTVAADGRLLPQSTFRDAPAKRLELVNALASAVRAKPRGLPSDPALAPLLADEQRRLQAIVELRRSTTALGRGLRGLGRTLYDYQREGVDAFLARGRLLLADDMGLGKTTQAIAACSALWKSGKVRRGLLVVPAALKFQWLDEWRKCSDAPIAIVEGTPADRASIRRAMSAGFLIANYEQLLRDLEPVRRWRPEIVVLDEAQRIKNWATRTAASVKSLDPDYRLVLTGTPFENRLDELASLLEWIDRPTLEPVWRLEPFHTLQADGTRKGARHLDVLRERLEPVLIRRRRSEILHQLPSRTDTRVDVELTPAQRDEHDALTQPIAALVHVIERRPLTQPEFLRLMSLLTTQRVIANGIAQLHFAEVWPGIRSARPDATLIDGLAMPKLDELREIFERIAVEQERKIVVFSQWRRALTLAHWATADLLERHGLRAAFFTGKETEKQRTRSLVDFHDDPATRILFATDAGGVGLNLQRAATCCVNFELPWNPAVLEQRVGRIHRIGQEQPIDVYNLVSAGCIEERIARLVGDKQALFKGLFDGDSNEVRFDGSGGFLASVRKIVGEAPAAAPQAAFDDVDGAAAERSVSAVVAAADEAADATPDATPAPPAADDVAAMFADLRIEHGADGTLRLEAPPETARTLAALLRGFADVLGASAR